MKKLAAILYVLLAGALSVLAQNSIRVEAPNIVGQDEEFNVTFIIEGTEKEPSSFDWNCGDDFKLIWGPQKGASVFTRIVNGKRSKSSQYTYTYILSPKTTGKFAINVATASVGGKKITSEPLNIEVLANGSSSSGSASSSGSSQDKKAVGEISPDDLFLKFSLSRTNVVIGEPITATLKLYQRVDIAGFEDAKFPTFNGFWSQETESPSNIEFRRESLDDKIYNTAVLRRYVLIPQQVGTVKIEPASLVCLVNVRMPSRSSSSIFDSFFDDDYRTIRKRISTQAVNVNVKSLPSGAPASFAGGVGKFNISARLSKDSLKTHEAASLLITVSGNGNVALLESPNVAFPPDFEVYDTKSEQNTDKSGTSGSKTFEYPFIPRSHGDFTIQPISYSYYDVTAGRYTAITTEPIQISVARGAGVASSSAESSTVLPAVERKGVRNVGNDIRYIVTKSPSFKTGTGFFVGSLLYWGLAALIVLLTVLTWFAANKFAARKADVALARNRGATRMARKRLKLAGEYLSRNLYSAFYEELHKALLGFASDKLNIGAEDLGKDVIFSRFMERGVAEEVAKRFSDLLDACEYARYSPDSGHEAMNAHYEEAVNVISAIDATMKGNKTNMHGKAGLVIVFALSLPFAMKADNLSYPDSLWTQGQKAYASGQWQDAASAWGKIVALGVTSDDVLYNIGNAYFKDGNYASAILYYEKALKVDPSNADARFNLEYAKEFIQDKIDPVPEFILSSIVRKLCYTMSSGSWAVLSLVLLALAGVLALLFLLSASPARRRVGFYGGILVLLMCFSSVYFAFSQKNDYVRSDSAIIMVPVTSVKSSPSAESAKDLFVLHEGTKVIVLDEVGGWKNISLSDGRQGWIPAGDIEII